ncbi:hypothetical protein [Dactylosporangium sp. CA-092794]|uniref:hypothetical protein n=1 Tax=Dactylosporangium sp. CA-092794 TaxID=3239929 RepID=UPI003D92C73B
MVTEKICAPGTGRHEVPVVTVPGHGVGRVIMGPEDLPIGRETQVQAGIIAGEGQGLCESSQAEGVNLRRQRRPIQGSPGEADGDKGVAIVHSSLALPHQDISLKIWIFRLYRAAEGPGEPLT